MKIPYELTIKGHSVETYEKILRSATDSKEMRKEIRRIFQQANRRIQNIENSGVISPALRALEQQRNLENGFSKFSISKLENWNDVKIAYSQAIEFLRDKTSTSSGAKQFEKQVLKQNRIEQKNIDILRRYYNNDTLTDREKNYVENYLAKYTDTLIEFEEAFNVSKDNIQKQPTAANLNDIMRAAAKDAENKTKQDLDNILNKFDNFEYY